MPALWSQTVPNPLQERVGIVVAVDPQAGILTLWHPEGPCSYFTHPRQLDALRIGGPVQALVDGRSVWGLRSL
jgi:hypothetical protein